MEKLCYMKIRVCMIVNFWCFIRNECLFSTGAMMEETYLAT